MKNGQADKDLNVLSDAIATACATLIVMRSFGAGADEKPYLIEQLNESYDQLRPTLTMLQDVRAYIVELETRLELTRKSLELAKKQGGQP